MSSVQSLATIAEYFRLGILVGLLLPTQAIAWADSVIAAFDVAPDGIIDVSWSQGAASTIDALYAVPGERSKEVAGHWLLALLRQSVPEAAEELQVVARLAMHIARCAELSDELYFRFDRLDDELSLARAQVYGTVEQCRASLVAGLAEYEPVNL